jgi:palmitoyl-protein thioesterase
MQVLWGVEVPNFWGLAISSSVMRLPLLALSLTPFGEEAAFPLKFRPAVVWHGLGDNYNSSSMRSTVELIKETRPGIFVHSIYADTDPQADERHSLFGDANQQVQQVCQQLQAIPELRGGFDAIGYSQGGLLLRALVERCPLEVHNLITFGSPHMGVSDMPPCEDDDWVCRRRNAVLKRLVWYDRVQHSVIPALYFRDPAQYDQYVLHSYFLADVNNENGVNATYARNLNGLQKLVMVKFSRDTQVTPKESAWFEEVDPQTGSVIGYDRTALYQQDLIGLRELDVAGKLDFLEIDDQHMRIPKEFLLMIVQRYVGGVVL